MAGRDEFEQHAIETPLDNSTIDCLDTAENVQEGFEEICQVIGSGDSFDFTGQLLNYHFFGHDDVENKWLEAFSNNKPSNETTIVIPFDCKLIALTYGNEENNTSSKIRISKNTTNSGTYEFEWIVSNKKYAYKSDIGPSNITFSAGDRIRVYAKKYNSEEPEELNIMVHLQILNNNTGEGGKSNGA